MSTSQRPHKKLRAWQYAMDLTTRVYSITSGFPRQEDYVLTAQLRRSAVSVPSNIAEGLARFGKKEKVHFLYTAQASLSELDTQIELCHRIGYIENKDCTEVLGVVQDIQMLLSGLIRSIKSQEP